MKDVSTLEISLIYRRYNNVIYDDYYKDKGFSDYILKPIDKRELINKILDKMRNIAQRIDRVNIRVDVLEFLIKLYNKE